jgi:glutaredoxin-dependent peroxiredoxin
MALQIGDIAPEFSLFDSDKQAVTLSQFAGKPVVILFFPQAFTGVCTTELCSIRDNIAAYNAVQAHVLAISVDSVFTLDKFKTEQGFNFPLLSDFNKAVSRSYGALYEDWILNMQGVSKRAAFVVDAAGKIAYAEVLESAGDLPNFEAVLAALAAH